MATRKKPSKAGAAKRSAVKDLSARKAAAVKGGVKVPVGRHMAKVELHY